MNDFVENPFISKSLLIVKNDSDDTIEIEQSNVDKYFQSVYFLVKRNNIAIPISFYSWQVPKDIYHKISSELLIYRVPIQVLKNKIHFDNMIIISKEILQQYNIFNYSLADKNIVVPILNIEFQNIVKYVEQYESTNTLNHIYNIMILNKYFAYKHQLKYVCSMIKNMEESLWITIEENVSNPEFNMTEKFKNRRFPTQTAYITDRSVAEVINKIFEGKKPYYNGKNMIKDEHGNYTAEEAFEKPTNNKVKKEKLIFNKSDINELFKVLDEEQRFYIFANLLVSKNYASLVINNDFILDLMKDIILKFLPLFNHLFSYTWINFYLQEEFKEGDIMDDEDFIFSSAAASKLPVLPFNYNKPKENGYTPLLISDNELKFNTNFFGIPDYGMNEGLSTLDEFKFHMNIFTMSNPEFDLFDGFDFVKNNAAITGGIMSACLPKKHPLLSRFNSKTKTEQYINYFNEYYSSSDIDIIFKGIKNPNNFADSAHELYNIIVVNLCRFSNADPQYIKLELIKIAYMNVSEKFIKENIDHSSIGNMDYIKNNINDEHVKELFKPYYEKLKLIQPQPDETKYPEMFSFDNTELKIYINDNTTDGISMSMTYKYKIKSPFLNHSLELYPTKNDSFSSPISKHHLPVVRAYYNGIDYRIHYLCITSNMTFMNMNYKYYAGTKDMFNINNKYLQRTGTGIWINTVENRHNIEYCKIIPKWSNLYSLQPTSSSYNGMAALMTPKSLNHKLFRPRFYNMDDYVDSVFVETDNRYNNNDLPNYIHGNMSTTEVIKSRFKQCVHENIMGTINYDMFQSIDKEGNIIPLKKWIIEMTWELFSKKK